MKTIPYSKWEKLTEEAQNDYIESGILPYVSPAELRGLLLWSRMVIIKGERCWEIERSREEPKIFPERISKTVSGITMWCKFNPRHGDYKMNLAKIGISIEDIQKYNTFLSKCRKNKKIFQKIFDLN